MVKGIYDTFWTNIRYYFIVDQFRQVLCFTADYYYFKRKYKKLSAYQDVKAYTIVSSILVENSTEEII